MAHTTAAWMDRVYDIVENGGPVLRKQVVLAAMDLVPPGRADRAWQNQKRWLASDRGYLTQQKSPPGSDRSIRAGARMLVQQSIWSAIKRGRLVQTVDDQGRQWLSRGRGIIEATPEQLSERARRAAATVGRERRSQMRSEQWAKMSEETRQRIRMGPRSIDPAKRSDNSRKGWITRRQHYTAEEIARQSTTKYSARRRNQERTADNAEAADGSSRQGNDGPSV